MKRRENPVYRFPSGELVDQDADAKKNKKMLASRLVDRALDQDETTEGDALAVGMLERALAMDPDNVLALNTMGTIQDRRQQYGAAIDWYRAALQRAPNDPDILFNAGAAIVRLIASTKFHQAFDTMPTKAEVIRLAGDGAKYLERAIALQPKDSLAYPFLARAYGQMGLEMKELGVLRRYRKLYPNSLWEQLEAHMAILEHRVVVHDSTKDAPRKKNPSRILGPIFERDATMKEVLATVRKAHAPRVVDDRLEGQIRSHRAWVLTSVPLRFLAFVPEADADGKRLLRVSHYMALGPRSILPGVAVYHPSAQKKREVRALVIDGNHRTLAAEMSGKPTMRMWMPKEQFLTLQKQATGFE